MALNGMRPVFDIRPTAGEEGQQGSSAQPWKPPLAAIRFTQALSRSIIQRSLIVNYRSTLACGAHRDKPR
jgi:hypothetical protein